MVESACINKSLFTLAKCVEAISRQDARIPYRETKMTRILHIGMYIIGAKNSLPITSPVARHAWGTQSSRHPFELNFQIRPLRRNADAEFIIGQNNSLTVMILNLAPVRTYHQDTLSSLNFANRAKKIEVREIENEPIFKGCTRAVPKLTGTSIQRQPLRPLATSVHNSAVHALIPPSKQGDRQVKAFSVYSDRARLSNAARMDTVRRSPLKRPSDPFSSSSRPAKRRSPDHMVIRPQPAISKEAIEKIVEDKVTDILAARALDQPSIAPQPDISEEVQKRQKKINGKDDSREHGLTFLLMAKQHAVRGEDPSALRMYTLAKEYFPDNKKLESKIDKLREKMRQRKPRKRQDKTAVETSGLDPDNNRNLVYSDCGNDEMPLLRQRPSKRNIRPKQKTSGVQAERTNAQLYARSPTLDTVTEDLNAKQDDSDYETGVQSENNGYESDGGFPQKAKTKKEGPGSKSIHDLVQTPRTKQLLQIVNARDVNQIRLLKGVGYKKADVIVEALCGADEDESNEVVIRSLHDLGRLKGVGPKTVENMRMGL